MSSPQPIAALKRPPLRNAGSSSSSSLRPQDAYAHPYTSHSAASSSSSLSGLEQYSPGHNTTSFQDFIKQTRSINPNKPLPPTPLASPPSLGPSQDGTRATKKRSSSVYSRTQSQWLPTSYPFQDPDFDVDPLPPLRPKDHDDNPYKLRDLPPVDNTKFLEPRPFAPLLISPSSSNGDLRPEPTPLALNNTMVLAPQVPSPAKSTPRTKARLMSISKAKRDAKAPGAVHLLPEELRAQNARRTERHSRLDSLDMLGLGGPPPPPPPPLPVSTVNGQAFAENSRRLSASRNSERSDGTYDVLKSSFHVGTGPSREMLPPQDSHERVTLKVPAGVRPRRSDEEERGRPRERSRRGDDLSVSPPKLFVHDMYPYDKAEKAPSEASNDTAGYDFFLAQYDRRPSAPRSFTTMSSTVENDDEVRQHMKMVPQPLFQSKAQAHPRQESSAGGSLLSQWRPNAAGSQESFSSGKSSGFPLRLSMESLQSIGTGRDSKGSTTGMIPISPPVGQGRQTEQRRKIDGSDMRRRDPRSERPALPTIDQSLDNSSSRPSASSSVRGNSKYDHRRNISETSTQASQTKTPLFQRAMNGVTKHVRKTSKLSDTSTTSTASPIAAPGSPHLLPSPVKNLPSSGWTGSAKATWEAAKSRAQRSRASISISAPTRPLAERMETLSDRHEDSFPGLINLTSINGLGTKVMENFREGKAAKRREGLKKMITVVGVGDGSAGRGTSEASSEVEWDSEFEDEDGGRDDGSGANWL
ncbi:unnamed protein product [Zymoseptoria tritici ST99CH_1A5]|nr:unnamed protein product [Zymoseptoria tritici ST99CH_1E4]SMR54565.1 unnamed protein product [Zymoseptoria tritici ST99CH_3D1]SMY24767.1 unnamed protein product [Zymoseptoria tritici ST99CH_1A5]